MPIVDGTTSTLPDDSTPWYKTLTRYHWFVLIVAALGWLFDCLDQQIFILFRDMALKDLLPEGMDSKTYGGYASEKQVENDVGEFGERALEHQVLQQADD